MQIRVVKDMHVDDDVVAKICSDFLDWLDEKGYEVRPLDPARLGDTTWSYESLAQEWTEDVEQRRLD